MPQRQVKVGETISAEELRNLVPVGGTISAEDVARLAGPASDFSNVASGASTIAGPSTIQGILQNRIPIGKTAPIVDEINALIGAGKFGMDVVQTGGQWLEDIPRQLQDIFRGRQNPFSSRNAQGSVSGVSPARTTATGADPFAATNMAQTGGKIGGDIALNTALASATGGASLPVQVATQGVGTGIIAASQGANPESAALLSMSLPVVARYGTDAVKAWLKARAQQNVTAAINPRTFAEKDKLAKVIEQVTAEKPFAFTTEGLRNQFASKADEVATGIDEAIQTAGNGERIVNANQVARKLEGMKDALKIDGKYISEEAKATADQLSKIQAEIKELGRVTAPYQRIPAESGLRVPGGSPTITQQTLGARLESLRKLKQNYGETVAAAQDYFFRNLQPGSRPFAANEGYFALQQAMIDASPELKALGKAYQAAATPREILAKNLIRNPQSGGLSRLGALAMTVKGYPGAGAALKTLDVFLKTPAYKLGKASLQTSMANALANGDLQTAIQVMTQMANEAATKGGR